MDMLTLSHVSKRFGANQVIDEAQYIKNHGTQAAKSVRLIQSGFRMALTGTPMENRHIRSMGLSDRMGQERRLR